MFVRNHESGWVVHARAKINLALEIIGRRADGYHQLETLLTAVRWYDSLRMDPAEDFSLAIHRCEPTAWSRGLPVPAGEQNLVYRAIHRLAQASGHPPTGRFKLVKRIPSQAGLGGGSSDAAAALALANTAWKLNYPARRLADVGAEVGVDVPFFLEPGAAIGTDRGDQLERVDLPSGMPVVIVQPSEGLATERVYQALGIERETTVEGAAGRCRALAHALSTGASVRQWQNLVRNGLQQAAELLTESIERVKTSLARLPVLAHQMTGSGSGYFALCRTWREATRTAAYLRGQTGQVVVATRTCP
jgi:4-diphosphocytidyl-2-C-methyl-D-erythritol kinase